MFRHALFFMYHGIQNRHLLDTFSAISFTLFPCFNSLTTKKTEDKIFMRKFSKNVKAKLYHIENSKTRRQTVKIWMRWLIMSHLIKNYAALLANSANFVSGT